MGVVLAVGLVIFFLRKRKSFKMGLVDKIWGFLRRPATTFRAVKEEGLGDALKYALICLVIFGALTGIVLVLWGTGQLFESESDSVWLTGEPLLLIPIIIGLSIVGGMLLIFIGGAWTHLWAYLLGRRQGCSYRQTLKALIYGATPIYLVGWVPFLAERAGGLLGVLVSIWALVLTIIGLRELHGITTGRAVGVSILAIVIPTFVILLLAVVGVALLVVLGFFWLFGGG